MNEEQDVRLLAQLISAQGGKLSALEAVLHGLLRSQQLSAAAIDSMNQELERVHAVHASHSMNPAFMQAYEATMAEMRTSAWCPLDD